MDTYHPYQTSNAYTDRSGYSEPRVLSYTESKQVLGLPAHELPHLMVRDASTLAELLEPISLPYDTTMAEQVFGHQAKQQKISLKHVANLLYERIRIHTRHLDDIAHRDMQTQEALFGAQLHRNLDNGKKALTITGMLHQLDQARRQEELAFWKDTAELRNILLENAQEYHSLRHRTTLLESLEPRGGKHD